MSVWGWACAKTHALLDYAGHKIAGGNVINASFG